MGIRETLNKNPAMTTGVTAGIIVLALVVIVWQVWPSRETTLLHRKFFFTVDDGKTYFADDFYKIPPFKHSSGREAVRAHVYQANEKSKPYVGWLEKFPDQIKPKLDKIASDPKQREQLWFTPEFRDEMYKLVKTPGGGNWVQGTPDVVNQLRMMQVKDGMMARELFPDK